MRKIVITAQISADTYKALCEISEKLDRTKSYIVRQGIVKHLLDLTEKLEDEEKQAAVYRLLTVKENLKDNENDT